MKIGVPCEVKSDEYRVSMLPAGVERLVRQGHEVLIEAGAGLGSGYCDDVYRAAGGQIIEGHEEVFARGDMIVKVKEPIASEYGLMRDGQVIFTYFHFAADRVLTDACLERGVTAIAYETLADARGRLPLLTPMSEVAGKMSIQEGAKYLERPMGGRGILLGGIPGVEPAKVLVLGGGVVGTCAARLAAGIGANVTLMDINLDRLRYLDEIMPANVQTVFSNLHTVREHAYEADLVIGAVLIPGGRCPTLITREMLKGMKKGAVIVDVGVDQGGCFETTRPTTHAQPTFEVEGVVHYCVANMPGAVSRTSTQGLCHATEPYVAKLADAVSRGQLEQLVAGDPAFKSGLNMIGGRVTNQAVADAFGLVCH